MDLFQHRYYRLNKILLKFIGLWPYQSVRERVVFLGGTLSFAFSIFVPQVTAFVNHFDDRYFIMECALSQIFSSFCLIKITTSIVNFQKMLQLLNHMRTDWEVWGRDCDVHILHEYAGNGRKMTILYGVMMITTSTMVVIQPIMPKIIDMLLKNGTEPGQFPIPVEYNYIDMKKYYFYIVVHCALCTFLGFFLGIAWDSMVMVYVQHGCGLFAILRCKLERLGRNQISAVPEDIPYGSGKSLRVFEYLTWCIDKHNHAIKYAELIDATYSWCFFFVAALNMILISINGVQVIERTNDPQLTIRLTGSIVMAMVHLYIECYMGQLLMDHSISIRNFILNAEWYALPMKAQKLLPMIIMRCNTPCKLTVAKLTVMSIETFAVILKTSLSYFTVLRSV